MYHADNIPADLGGQFFQFRQIGLLVHSGAEVCREDGGFFQNPQRIVATAAGASDRCLFWEELLPLVCILLQSYTVRTLANLWPGRGMWGLGTVRTVYDEAPAATERSLRDT